MSFIVLKTGTQVSEDELFAHMQHYLAGYKVPRSIEFRTSLPISAAGKILKRELRAQLTPPTQRAPAIPPPEPKARGAAWTEERGTSDEGRRRR